MRWLLAVPGSFESWTKAWGNIPSWSPSLPLSQSSLTTSVTSILSPFLKDNSSDAEAVKSYRAVPYSTTGFFVSSNNRKYKWSTVIQQRTSKLRRGTLLGVFSRGTTCMRRTSDYTVYYRGFMNLSGEGGSYESYSWGAYHLLKPPGWKSCA